MQLGNFSVSLTVKDVHASKEFYEKLGFKVSGGDLKHNYVVMQNDTSTIGLYQGMFEKNALTYNPGWDRAKTTLAEFQDVREIQRELKKRGLNPVVAADESTTGPAYLTLVDPDGNPILIDQHVTKPASKQ
jgi:catechol 2,3-dioxygenase-like lactoylglutathione lyase family enzyme